MAAPLHLNYFVAPAGPGSDSWIAYVRDVLIDVTPDDIGDARTYNGGYQIDDYAAPGKSGLLTWLNDSVDRLEVDSLHTYEIHPFGLTLDGEPARLVACDSGLLEKPSAEATAFALIAWLVTNRQAQDRHDLAV